MKYSKAYIVITVIASAALLYASPKPALAKVTNVVLSASPAEFRGTCPGVVTFNGAITVDAPGIVRYIFTRSDGATDTIIKTLIFKRVGTKMVKTTWTLGDQALPYYEGWEAIKVILPKVFTSKPAKFKLKCDPPADSALSAHGDTDWHVNTANEFLFGKNMSGTVTVSNHAPDSWTKKHMHVGMTNTAKYYYDKSLITSGKDVDTSYGIDRTMLFFYAGHGSPTLWHALGENASQFHMKLANIVDGGNLRYYWQCSCEVFAHGPYKTDSCGASLQYGCPQNFDGSHDSVSMRNIFERWGPALTSDLRMACGGSTSMWCSYNNVEAVWDDYNNNGMGVAESFIDGFGSSHPGVVPLCITMGGSDIANTPLYTDTTFSNKPNTSGSTYYHIMYLGGTQTKIKPLLPPLRLPKLIVEAAAIPPHLKSLPPSKSIADARFSGGKAVARIDPASGSVHMIAVMPVQAVEKRVAEKDILSRANAFVEEMKWDTNEMTAPVLTQMMTASMPVGGKSKDVRTGVKSVVVSYSRQIVVNETKVDVLGAGGKVKVLMTSDGRILSANRVWRKIKGRTAEVNLKTFEEAQAEALKKLPEEDVYKLDQWKWGYKEPAGNEQVREMKVVYQFWYAPKKHEDLMQYPPVFTEISAEK